MKRRKGCLRYLFFVFLAIFLLYFLVGNGKTDILKKVYPIKYQEAVEKYADEYGLDRYLVYSVIKVESGFDEKATSNVGAKGLMQLMERTAEECNVKGGFDYSIPEDLYNPEKNIRLGCFYLSSLMKNYEDMELAITAYNGGTGNVRKWLADKSLSDGEGGLSEIPYAETENYVRKIKNTYEMYNKLYKSNEL